MSFIENDVWDRQHDSQASTISRQLYILLVCFWTGVGVAFSAVMAFYSQKWDVGSWNQWAYLGFAVGVLVVAMGGDDHRSIER